MNYRQVHLDFHTSEHIEDIGKDFSKENFQEMLKKGHVNSITVFSKCHHGMSYHPTRVGIMHPHLDFDLLGVQIEAAHEIGVKTPVYLSAGIDGYMMSRHPEWLRYSSVDGKITPPDYSWPGFHHPFCFNTPYLDYLIEQIQEVLKNYDADGIFLDIVGVNQCCCQSCLKELHDRGEDPSDPDARIRQAERVYANYTRRVRECVDSVRPGLPVFHNSGHITRGRRDLAQMNTHLELESLPTGGWGYDHFPLSAAYAQTLGMDYLGMTGKFHGSWGEFGGYKHKNALRYEVSLSAAFGARCSVGDQLHPRGQMDYATYTLIGAAYSEIEEKEPWLHNAKNIADVALLSIQSEVWQDKTDSGVSRILLEGGYLFHVVDGDADYSKYKVIIVPDNLTINEKVQAKLKDFVAGGGKLLCSGTSCLNREKTDFLFDLGAKYIGDNQYNPDYIRPRFDLPDMEIADYVMYSRGIAITPTGDVLADRVDPYFNRSTFRYCSHKHTPPSPTSTSAGITEGRDGIYIAWNVFEDYATSGMLILKKIVCYALDRLLGDGKSGCTSLPAQGVFTLTEQKDEGRLIAHLLYASPVKRGNGVEVIEDLVPIYGTRVSVKIGDKNVRRVYLAPQNETLDFSIKDGTITFTVPKFECHQMVVIE